MVGIGPGGPGDRTRRAEKAIADSEVVVGYTRYLDLVKDLLDGKEVISSGMTREMDRCEAAIAEAQQGRVVALISSGDSGIYGMAGLTLEMAAKEKPSFPIEIIPGVTSASAAAARLGAPLMLDFAVISLSDLLVPWDVIKQRLEAVASADMVTVLYNPRSRKRRYQLDEATEIFRKHLAGTTPVGIGTAVGTEDEHMLLSDLDHFLEADITMRSIVIIGNSTSRNLNEWFVTPRGYKV